MPTLLPTANSYLLTPSDDIPSELLNELQDCIRGAKFPSLTRWFLPRIGVTTVYGYQNPGYIQSTTFGVGYIPVETVQGERITGANVKLYGNGAVNVTVDLIVLGDDMVTTTTIGTITDNARGAAWASLALGTFTPHIMAAGETLYFAAAVTGANHRIGRCGVTRDRL